MASLTRTSIGNTLRRKPSTIAIIILICGIGWLVHGDTAVYIVLAVFLFILWLMKSTWSELGLQKPKSWKRVLLLSFGLMIASVIVVNLLTPLIVQLFGIKEELNLSKFSELKGNELRLLRGLVIAWTTAAFGEELIWRGFVMKKMALLLGDNRISWIIALLFSSLFFGLIHSYQGPVGMIQTGLAGLILGTIFILNGRKSLWVNIFMHGMTNTLSYILIYFGVLG